MRITGRYLNSKWNVGAIHSLYREDGTWYHHLKHFPGALFDYNGYLLFENKEDYNYYCENYFSGKEEIAIPQGISNLPGYVRKR